MPFSMELRNHQKTKKWSFERTKEALELQYLLDSGERKKYGEKLIELSKETNGSGPHKFTRIKGTVYELIDKGETITVPIRFQVKETVITWSFNAPLDVTHQSFRDLVFNTAAKAHACVRNSCETYYRGTDHLHIKKMHIYPEEANLNHNHYRTANDGPITPVEVYEHLVAFYAQKEGKQFIASEEERDTIILTFAQYWAQFNADIKYVALFLMKYGGGYAAINRILADIAKIGSLTPDEADKQIDDFFSSEQGKNIHGLAATYGFPINQLSDVQKYIKEVYRKTYLNESSSVEKAMILDSTLELHKSSSEVGHSSTRSVKTSSPRDEYQFSYDQVFDEIDVLEYQTFANDLTKHCQSIDKSLLQDLELDDFRKGLVLYHALRTAQHHLGLLPGPGQRFHSSLTTKQQIQKMINELPFLQSGSTEDSLGGVLLSKLVVWVKTAPPELDDWVNWVKVNGSRGLGAEIALVRQTNGIVDLKQAVPLGDRGSEKKLAEINFDKANLKDVFIHPVVKNTETISSVKAGPMVVKLQEELGDELKQLLQQQLGINRLEPSILQAKIKVIDAGLSVLSGRMSLKELVNLTESNTDWKWVSSPKVISRLGTLIQKVIELEVPEQSSSLQLFTG